MVVSVNFSVQLIDDCDTELRRECVSMIHVGLAHLAPSPAAGASLPPSDASQGTKLPSTGSRNTRGASLPGSEAIPAFSTSPWLNVGLDVQSEASSVFASFFSLPSSFGTPHVTASIFFKIIHRCV